jgi:hypothetical protein
MEEYFYLTSPSANCAIIESKPLSCPPSSDEAQGVAARKGASGSAMTAALHISERFEKVHAYRHQIYITPEVPPLIAAKFTTAVARTCSVF